MITARRTWLFILLSAIPLFCRAQVGSNTVYRVSELTESFRRRDKANSAVRYHHVFTYDKLGRPSTHFLEFHYNDQLVSSSTMQYTYDEKSGKLLSQSGDRGKYAYFYNADNYLSRITLHLRTGTGWQLTEETTLEYAEAQKGERLITYTMNKLRVSGPRKDKVDRFSVIQFRLDQTKNRIIASRTLERNYLALKSPEELTYQYDDKPNPLQQIFVERWYEFDLLNRSMSNLSKITSGTKTVGLREYQYNEQGYPTQYILDKRRTMLFNYERMEVAVPKAAESLVRQQVSSMSLFPNPATTEITVAAQKLGVGSAKVNIIDLNGRVLRSTAFSINETLEALIPLAGIGPGFYVVELLAPAKKERKKLVVQ